VVFAVSAPPARPGDSPERYRDYLLFQGRLLLGGQFPGKVDLSGVVQQTLLEAHAELDRFRGLDVGQRAAWLGQLLANNLTDEVRRFRTAARDAGREQSLEALGESAARAEAWLAADQSSPSQRASRGEQLLRLADALARLPDDQRAAVELHHLGGLTIDEAAARLGKSFDAVVGLLYRGLRRLRELLAEPD
jgi:RNA polymerase sigma-70 factor (ECF subfamily)